MNLFPDRYNKNKFWKFVLPPKDDVSLKLFFDNIRNFGIAAAVIAAGRYYQKHGGNLLEVRILITFGILLIVLNCSQLWVLFLKTFYIFSGFDINYKRTPTLKDNFIECVKIGIILTVMFCIPYIIYILITTVI